jgi:hypothetical protein
MLMSQMDVMGGHLIRKTGSKAAGFIFAHIHIVSILMMRLIACSSVDGSG